MSKTVKPHIAPDRKVREFTVRATSLGVLFGFFFAVANGYLALKIGTTISASIPAAIMSMAVLRLLFRDASILENNIVQTVAAVGEALAAGVVFTVPALILLGDSPSIGRIFLLTCLGGILGILFMIPMRRFVIVEEHKKLPFPEGTACAAILKSGEKDTGSSVMALWGILFASVYKLCSNAFFFWQEVPSWTLRFLKNTAISLDAAPALLGVGYIIGPRITSVLFAGGAFAWWVIIPLIKTFGLGSTIIYPSQIPVTEMSADEIWSSYVRYIGAGTLAVGGLMSLVKIAPLLFKTVHTSIKELAAGFQKRDHLERTEKDIPMGWLILGSVAIILLLWLFPGFPMNFFTIVLLVVLGFFFVAVTSITVGLVGSTSNPTSGMVITTLLITCLTFVVLGWTERIYLISALTMGVVTCCAISMAGTTAQDLKTGFLLGATPISQQLAEIVGVFLPALALGYTVYLLNEAYHFGSALMPAPQATLMAMIANGVISGDLPYGLVGIGILIGCIVALLRIPILPFALGVYLPLSLNTATIIGGLVRVYVNKHAAQERTQENGLLLASGMVGGDACVGVILALLTVIGVLTPETTALLPGWVSLLSFFLLALLLAAFTLKGRSSSSKS